MEGPIQARAGWGGELLEGASPALRARVAAADLEYEREASRQREERALLAEQKQAAAIAASVRMAEERGEVVSRQERVNGVGRTKSEALSYYSAVMDVEDARRAALQRKRLERFEQHQQDLSSGDTTAPSEADVAELEEVRGRAAKLRARLTEGRRIKAEAVREARRLASVDRQAGYLYRGESA